MHNYLHTRYMYTYPFIRYTMQYTITYTTENYKNFQKKNDICINEDNIMYNYLHTRYMYTYPFIRYTIRYTTTYTMVDYKNSQEILTYLY